MQDRHLCWPTYIFFGPEVPPPHFINSRIATVSMYSTQVLFVRCCP